jgi:SAM-dependent methyltransferase
MPSNAALTTTKHWDNVWTPDTEAGVVPRIETDVSRHQARLLRLFRRFLGPGKRFIEVGVGGSAWPAFLARNLGVEAWGIDNSRPGLELALRSAKEMNQTVHLLDGDLFDQNLLPRESFDVVYSGGFVEHFKDSRPVMQRLHDLVAPRGVVITTVPNFTGLNGILQGFFDPECLACHVLYDPRSLDQAHAAVGLRPIEPANWEGIIDVGSVDMTKALSRLPRLAVRGYWFTMARVRRAGEFMATAIGKTDGGRPLSPAIVGVYQRG